MEYVIIAIALWCANLPLPEQNACQVKVLQCMVKEQAKAEAGQPIQCFLGGK